MCWLKDGEGNTGDIHKRKNWLTRRGFQVGHEWEEMDVTCFLSTTHVFGIFVEHLLHLMHSSQC